VTATDSFVEHRNLLFTVAYEMLGSAADAEDVLQETWLRWAEVDRAEVRDERAYLVRITTRLSLNRMRTMARRRESYVGPWLPEPLLTSPDVAEDVELADSVSMAMLVVLESLMPTERAVFVLREVFELGYDEIASRARAHVAERRPRGDVTPSQRDEVIVRFLGATASGDLQSLMDVLAPDVVLLTDGGGVKKAALRPILGREKVVRFLDAVAPEGVEADVVVVNGAPALRLLIDGEVDGIGTMLVEDGLVTGLYIVRNPAKLSRLDDVVALTR
jgi:RNA polymerase sigma factor (sigma-70 family)